MTKLLLLLLILASFTACSVNDQSTNSTKTNSGIITTKKVHPEKNITREEGVSGYFKYVGAVIKEYAKGFTEGENLVVESTTLVTVPTIDKENQRYALITCRSVQAKDSITAIDSFKERLENAKNFYNTLETKDSDSALPKLPSDSGCILEINSKISQLDIEKAIGKSYARSGASIAVEYGSLGFLIYRVGTFGIDLGREVGKSSGIKGKVIGLISGIGLFYVSKEGNEHLHSNIDFINVLKNPDELHALDPQEYEMIRDKLISRLSTPDSWLTK